MISHPFWLSDSQWTAIAPLLPTNQRGPKRVSDRVVISGIAYVLRSGCAWRDCPREYGPYMTVFNRYNRWKRRGLWSQIAAGLDLTSADANIVPVETAETTCLHDVVEQLKAVLSAHQIPLQPRLVACLMEWRGQALPKEKSETSRAAHFAKQQRRKRIEAAGYPAPGYRTQKLRPAT
jgi:hypothetical protein